MIVSTVLPALPAPDPAVLSEALRVPPTAAAHDRLAAALPAVNAVEYRPPGAPRPLGLPLRVIAWNAERCKYGPASAALLAATRADLVLLSEVDVGMARSGNRHTVADLAAALGLGALFGVEFVELGLGDDREQRWHAGQANDVGFHGNAILSPAPLESPCLIRLNDGGHWFTAADGDERRLGCRMALAARIPAPAGPLFAVSVHLEDRCDPAMRAAQTARLVAAVDDLAAGLPVVIGGDFNTKALPPGDVALHDPERFEPLFSVLRDAGYRWTDANTSAPTMRTRPDGTPPPPIQRLDRLFVRGLAAHQPAVLPAVDANGSAISDHEVILADLSA